MRTHLASQDDAELRGRHWTIGEARQGFVAENSVDFHVNFLLLYRYQMLVRWCKAAR